MRDPINAPTGVDDIAFLRPIFYYFFYYMYVTIKLFDRFAKIIVEHRS